MQIKVVFPNISKDNCTDTDDVVHFGALHHLSTIMHVEMAGMDPISEGIQFYGKFCDP